ncbi:MAG: hypothetical protein JST93_36120 [Acidobacteria bacterium]|nr:hypothetical protein [Acidobacteriota bacterium]
MPVFLIFLLFTALQPAWSSSPKPFAFGAVRFEANQGQADPAALYFARARGQHVYFMQREIVFDASEGSPVRMSFTGASKARWTPVGVAVDRISYYLGNDPSRWVKDAPVYSRLAWRNLYPGIDAVFYDRGGHVEYDLVLAPGADPSCIRLRFSGASRIESAADGDIEIKVGAATLRQHAPEIYQQDQHGKRRLIHGRFVAAANGEFYLQLGSYQKNRTLIVDPVLEASGYLGGENDDEIVAVSETFIAGNTRSAGFPATPGARRRSRDIFLTGIGLANTITFYSTAIIGGSGDDELAGFVVPRTIVADVTLAGTTNSRDFPGSSPSTSAYQGGASDGFILNVGVSTRITTMSVTPRMLRYVGGSGEDRIHSIQIYPAFATLFAGVTDSPDLATAPGGQRTPGGGTDAFFGILDSSNNLALSYLGGSGNDAAYSVLRISDSFLIAGETRSTDFPAATTVPRGPSDGFLTRVRSPFVSFNSPATFEILGTELIGGSGEDSIRSLAPPPGTATPVRVGFAGTTTSPDLPVRNAAQPAFGGGGDAFAGMWIPSSSSLAWLTYMGGSAGEAATSAALSTAGDLSVGGWTRSTDLPVVDALQPKTGGGQDGFFALYDDGGKLRQFTYFGGSGDDRIDSVATLASGSTRVGGATTSTNLPQSEGARSEYAAKLDGFHADIGTDYLSGPSEVILPKDGALQLILRPARSAFRPAITFRSSDPSRLRFSFAGRPLSEFTAAAQDGVRLEALSDSGEVEVTATAQGFPQKTIRVKLYPGVVVLSGATSLYTWSPSASVFINYRAIDPTSNKFVGEASYLRRDGVAPSVRWASSNPDVVEVQVSETSSNGVQLRVRGPGQSRITVDAPGWRVLEAEPFLVTVSPMELLAVPPVRLGRNLQGNLPIQFMANGLLVSTGYRGTLTARSEDPSRLLVTASSSTRGSGEVTVAMNQRPPVIFAQALAGSGEVRVIVTSSEFPGEIPFTVKLEPAVIRWARQFSGQESIELVRELPLRQGAEESPSLWPQSESGGFASGFIPGAPPVLLNFSNSDASVVSLSRLTTNLTSQRITLRGLRPGTAQLSLSVTSGDARVEPASVSVTVTPANTAAITSTTQLVIGKDLQTALQLRTSQPGETVSLTSSDPTAILFSTSNQSAGTPTLDVAAPQSGGIEVFLQSLKAQGETTVRIRANGTPDADTRVTHVPSGVVLSSTSSGGVIVAMYPLDEESGTPLLFETLRPGVSAEVRLRTEGAPLRLSRETLTLSAQVATTEVSFDPLPTGAETLLIAEAPGFTESSRGRLRLRAAEPPPAVSISSPTVVLTRDTLQVVNFGPGRSETTVTSGDPSKLLVAASISAAPAASVRLPIGASSVYLHALAESGNTVLRFEAAGLATLQMEVAFVPLLLRYNNVTLSSGQTGEVRSAFTPTMRPGAGPFRFALSSANPSVATVSPASFEWSPPQEFPTLRVTAVSPGTTTITADGQQTAFLGPIPVSVVSNTTAQTQQEILLARNAQVAYTHSLGAILPAGGIVTVTSSDPARLVLSRSSTALGTGSLSVAVSPGAGSTQQFYLQARAQEGTVSLRFQVEGGTTQTLNLRLTNSWVACNANGRDAIAVVVGQTTAVSCFLSADLPSQPGLQGSLQFLPDAGSTSLRFRSSDPGIFTAPPEAVPLRADALSNIAIRGVSPGSASLLIDQPDGFGPAPSAPTVTVTLPELQSSCTEVSLGPDTQRTCEMIGNVGVTVTAESSHPALTLVSNNPDQPGSAQAVLTAPRIAIQQLARFGTSEITLRAPGYSSLTIPVVATEATLRLTQAFSNSPLTNMTLRAGASMLISVQLNGQARAGSSILAAVNTTPTGVVAVEPASVTLAAGQSSVNLTLRAVAPGSAVIRLTAPEGITVASDPIAVSVIP